MKTDWTYRRGDIYLANLNPFKGSEQGGKRPVVVLQNNTGNLHSSTIIVATMTSHTDKKKTSRHIISYRRSEDSRRHRWCSWNRSKRSTNAG